jgi:hypothetical protein
MNTPPVLKAEIPLCMFPEDNEGDKGHHLLNLSEYFDDDGGAEKLEYSVVHESNSSHVKATVDGCFLSFSAQQENWNGEETIRARATDGMGLHADSNNFTVRVTAVNDLPAIVFPFEVYATEDTVFRKDLETCAEDAEDDAGALVWRVVNASAGVFCATIEDKNILRVAPLPDQYTRFGKLRLAVRDLDGGETAMNVTVNIMPVNDVPFFLELPVVNVTKGKACTLDLWPYVDDVDNPKQDLKISSTSPHVSLSGFNLTIFYSTEIANDTIPVIMSDGLDTASAVIHVRMGPGSEPGRGGFIRLPEDGGVFFQHQKIAFEAEQYDKNGSAFNFTWYLDGNVIGNGRNLSTAALGPGSHTISVVASDGGSQLWSDSINVTVKKKPAPPGDDTIPGFETVSTLAAAVCLAFFASRRASTRNKYDEPH